MEQKKREVVLTRLADHHISEIYQYMLEEDEDLAMQLMDEFLDLVFSEIPRYPYQFPLCEGIKSKSRDYRIASLSEGFRVIYQVYKDKVLILMILHESELPF